MKRRHLPELEDETWFPAYLRDMGTDYLQWVMNVSDAYKDLVPTLQKGLSKAKKKVVIDIASGGGGGWSKLGPRLKEAEPGVKVMVTDFFPHVEAFKALQAQDPELFSYSTDSVDAKNISPSMEGLRTQFLSYHHFRPEDAQQILQNAVDCQAPIMIVEVTERSVKQIIQFAFTPLLLLFLTPFIRPFKLGRLFFTYIIPILPAFITWDGIASACRTYKPEEIEAMTKNLKNGDSFTWEIGWQGKGPRRIMVALGYPK
jgi:hypothetical protein